jgi:hypothetical protein
MNEMEAPPRKSTVAETTLSAPAVLDKPFGLGIGQKRNWSQGIVERPRNLSCLLPSYINLCDPKDSSAGSVH